ncbi:MAG: chorismate mutase [Chloroflexota bacterium]
MSDPAARLQEIRAAIDAIDDQLLTLLAARTELALEAGEVKSALGRAVQDPEREAALLARVAARGAGALTPEDLVQLWTLLMAATRRAESRR